MKRYLIMAARFAVKETTRKAVKYVFRGVVVAATGASIVILNPIVGVYTASIVGTVCGGLVDYGVCSIAGFAASKADRYVSSLLLLDPALLSDANSNANANANINSNANYSSRSGAHTLNRSHQASSISLGSNPGMLHAFAKHPGSEMRVPATSQQAIAHYSARF